MLNPNIYERKPEINEANLQIEIEYLLTKHKDKLEDNQVEKRLRDLKNDIDKDITILQYCESTFKRYFLDAELKRNLIFLSNLVQEKADSSQKNIFVEEINANLLSRLLEDFKGDELHINAGITRFPEKVLVQYPEKMKELKSIIIEGLNECNKLIDFPSTLCKLSMLESLTLTHHSFKHIPDEINQLNNLKSLNLSNNELIYINPQIGKLTQLTSLKLNKNILSGRLPLDIVNCVNLGSLDIDDNLFDYLPPLEGLSKLDTLRVRNNNLRAFPNVFSDDNHLETLDISFNKICSISDGILHLTHLKHLNASGNQITNISPSIKNLVQLETLDLQTNFLTDLPPEIGQLKKLCFLSLNDNRIRSLTPAVGQLKNLKWLYLEKNLLSTLPSELSGCQNLLVLELGFNQLVSVCDLSTLQILGTLSLNNNQLKELPTSIGRLTRLKNFNASYNLLDSLPPELSNLGQCQLSLEGNKLTNVSQALINKYGNDWTFDVLSHQHQSAITPMHTTMVNQAKTGRAPEIEQGGKIQPRL